MRSGIRTVMGPDGTHMESEVGSLRTNLTTGEISTVIGGPDGSLRTVLRPDGSSVMERQVGSMRFSSDGRVETVL